MTSVVRAGRHLGTPWEAISALPIIDYVITPPLVRMAQMALPGLRRGQCLSLFGRVEVTNDTQDSVEMSWGSVMALGPSGVGGYPMTRVSGENIIPENYQGQTFPGQHHFVCYDFGAFEVPLDGDYWYAIVGYAGGGSVNGGMNLTVNPWGTASALIFD